MENGESMTNPVVSAKSPVSWILFGTFSSTFCGSFSCSFCGTMLEPTAWDWVVEVLVVDILSVGGLVVMGFGWGILGD